MIKTNKPSSRSSTSGSNGSSGSGSGSGSDGAESTLKAPLVGASRSLYDSRAQHKSKV